MQSVKCDKLQNCHLLRESSRDLNWVATSFVYVKAIDCEVVHVEVITESISVWTPVTNLRVDDVAAPEELVLPAGSPLSSEDLCNQLELRKVNSV